ncbi:MAG: MAPEG family protein [Pseudomonadota bacterium]
MELVILVVCLALIQYIFFTVNVGRARMKYGVRAPAMSGNPVFERYLRVQQNTLEQLVLFIPVQFMFAWSADNLQWYGNEIAAALGVVWLIGRALYARSYVKEPLSRSVGFMLTVVPSMLLLGGALVAVFVSLL